VVQEKEVQGVGAKWWVYLPKEKRYRWGIIIIIYNDNNNDNIAI